MCAYRGRENKKMTLKWHHYKDLRAFSPPFRIANDALIGLYTICDTKMSQEEIRERYMPRIEKSLVLFDKLIAFAEKRYGQFDISDLYIMKELFRDIGTSDNGRIKAELKDAKRELRLVLEERQVEAPKAARILEMIESVASAKTRAIARLV